MSGSLHLFRRDVVNGSSFYQVNYNLAGRSFAFVLDSGQLEEFLGTTAGFREELIASTFQELETTGNAHLMDVHIGEGEAVGHGMIETPSDF
jgi:hypothetical protein